MISIIIPTYNDERAIAGTISHVKENAYKGLLKQIIVVDGGSTDKTVREAEKAGATVIHSIRRGRAPQMNLGAQYATGKILYFLFPGSFPPKHFTNEIVRATQKGFSFGFFTLKFDYKHWALNAVSRLTRMKATLAQLENQSLFVLRELFVKAGKFREDLLILEDHEIITRLKRYSSFIVLKDHITASANKYISSGVVRTQLSYLTTHLLQAMGCSQEKIMKVSRALLRSKQRYTQRGDVLSASFN